MKPEHSISLYAGSGTVEGTRGDHILLAPPYNVTKEEIDIIVDTTARVVNDVLATMA